MNEAETTEPSRSRGLFTVVAGRAANSSESFSESTVRCKRRAEPRSASQVVSFDRSELRIIFDLYGAKVAAGEWRDYAIDFTCAKAVFSIFRWALEGPLYRIEKNPALARRQGAFSVVSASGMVLRRGPDLARVIGVLDRKLRLVQAE